MVTMPLLLILGIILFFTVRKSGHHPGHAFAAVLFGLLLAGSPVGDQLISGLNSFADTVVSSASQIAESGGDR